VAKGTVEGAAGEIKERPESQASPGSNRE